MIRVALLLLAAHTVVDAFAGVALGTSWSDRLLGTLLPLAALAAVALALPRLRPGGRAIAAAALGALSLVAFGLAVAGVSRPTGYLLGPVGVALLVHAARVAWEARRGGRWRALRRLGIATACVVGTYCLLVPVAMALFATHRPRADAARLHLPGREVTVPTADGLRLAASFVPSRNGAVIVTFPTRRGSAPAARMLARHGYGVLMLDMRGYDGSEGRPNAFGWGATKDIDAGVAWLNVRGIQRVGGIGFSVGGEQMLEAASRNRSLRAVVSDGAGERSVGETLLHGVRGALALPEAVVQTAALAALSRTLPPPSLRDVAARIAPRAAFFVYAEHGLGGEELNRVFYRAAGRPKAIWQVPGAHHTAGLRERPQEYEQRVVAFFDRYLAARTLSR